MASSLRSGGVLRSSKRVCLGFIGVLGAVACNTHDASHVGAKRGVETCRNDDECGPDNHCDFSLHADLGGLALPLPSSWGVPMIPPCTLRQCVLVDGVAPCAEEQTCVPVEQARRLDGLLADTFVCNAITHVCGTRCTEDTNCSEGEVCRETGQCERSWCDEPDGLSCPDGMYCDREVSMRHATASVRGAAPVEGFATAVQRGCALVPCDQEGGVSCLESWRCDPSTSQEPGGCAPIACQESGRCSSEALICEPTSTRSRPAGMDPHGCVPRNCEEGVTCSFIIEQVEVGYCDFDGPFVQSNGCAARRCDEVEGTCAGTLVCDPDASSADERGCRLALCTEGTACASAATCDPTHPNADSRGCVYVPNETETTTTATSGVSTAPTSGASTTAVDTSTSKDARTSVFGTDAPRSSGDVERKGVCVAGAAP